MHTTPDISTPITIPTPDAARLTERLRGFLRRLLKAWNRTPARSHVDVTAVSRHRDWIQTNAHLGTAGSAPSAMPLPRSTRRRP